MPDSRPDTTVAIVDMNGDPDMTVAVIGDQVVSLVGSSPGDVLTVQAGGDTVAPEPPASQVAQTITNGETTTAPSQDAVFDALAARVAYRLLFLGHGKLDAAAAQTTGLGTSGSAAPGGSAGGQNVFYLDPADWPAGTTLRVKATVMTNDVAPNTTFTVGLYPVGATSGGAAVISAALGAVVAGSTAAIATPAANSKNVQLSSDFAAPAAGYYALAVVVSSNMAASSSVVVRGVLDAKH